MFTSSSFHLNRFSIFGSPHNLPSPHSHLGEFVLISQLESVTQRSHVRILITLELETLGNRSHWQTNHLGGATSLEAEPKVSGMLVVDAECVR